MNYLIFLLIGLITLNMPLLAGVGGIIGGSDKIHFQKASAWVSVVRSKSLCFDGNSFRADVTKCLKRNDKGDCSKQGKVKAVQPAESTRTICRADESGHNEKCKIVPYKQSPIKVVKFKEHNGNREWEQTFKVKSCHYYE